MRQKIALLLVFTLFFNITAAAQNDPAEETVFLYEDTASSGGFFAETGENAAIKWTTQISKSFSSGFCSCVLYKDCLYTAADKKIYKIDRSTGKIIKTAALYTAIGYTYYITQAEGKIFVQLKNGAIQAFSADTLDSLWISETPQSGSNGQGLSPICYDNGHIYACTAVMSKNYGKGVYFCLDTADEKPNEQYETKNFIWQLEAEDNSAQTSGFYGTGAAVSGENIIFGSEGGTVYLADKSSGEVKDRLQTGVDVRSAVSVSGSRAYFTAKDGSLYSAEIGENGFGEVKSQKFCADSSCEPVVKNGRVYAGGTDGGYTKGVFCVFDASSLEILAKFDVSGNVQARPLALENGGGVSVYFTCNNTPGKVMRLDDTGNGFDISTFFTPSEEYAQYCINRVNTDGTALYYQNDSGIVIALEYAGNAEPVSEQTTAETFTETTALTESTTEAATETTTRASSHSGGGGGGSHTAQYINVSFEIIGDTPHGEQPHSSSVVWLANDVYKTEKGSTAEDLVLKALDKNGFEYVIHSNGYISEITSPDGVRLAEFTNGINSGWMYTQNGVFVQTALRGCVLGDGDTIVLLYSDDYTKTDTSMRSDSSDLTLAETTTEQTTENAQETVFDEETTVFVQYFDDVETGVWYFYPVECLHAAGIVNGRGNGLFCPDDTVSRAEFAAMLYRVFGKEGGSCNFADVPEGSWFHEAAAWAQNAGVIYGRDETHFAPYDPVTRQEAAAMLYRLADGRPEGDKTGFSDNEQIAPYALEAVVYLSEHGIVKGSKGRFYPLGALTRAETASLLFEFIQKECMNK